MITDAASVRSFLRIPDSFDPYDEVIERLIFEVETHIEQIQNKPFDRDDSDEPIYPDGYESTAIYMVGWNLKNRHGLANISIGDYSQGTQEMIQGYPKDLTYRIKRYVNAH